MSRNGYQRIVVQHQPSFPLGLLFIGFLLIPLALAAVILGVIIIAGLNLLLWGLSKLADEPKAVTADEHSD